MSTSMIDTAAMSSRWADLPRDLLLDILFRLHDAADYVRFHAVCRAWRDPILPPLCRPVLLPWLRAPHAGYGIWKTRRIFSSKTSVHRKAHGIFALMSSLHRKAGCIFSSKISIHDGALPGNRFQRGYNVESRGQSLYLLVRLQDETGDGIIYNDGILVDHVGAIGSPLASTVSVSVYALEGTEEDRPRWVPKDGRNFADQVIFLGQPSSFAVDAVRFGMTGRGCAYFVDARQVHRRIRGKLEPDVRCRVLKYGFHDGKLELVEELPEDWNRELCTWLTPQPSIAPAEEIRERLDALNRKVFKNQSASSACFRFEQFFFALILFSFICVCCTLTCLVIRQLQTIKLVIPLNSQVLNQKIFQVSVA